MQEPEVPEQQANAPRGRDAHSGEPPREAGSPNRRSEALEAELAALEAMLARDAASPDEPASYPHHEDEKEPDDSTERGS